MPMKRTFFIILLLSLLIDPSPVRAEENSDGYKELDAINNRCKTTLPGVLCPDIKKDDSFFTSFLESILGFFWNVDRNANINKALEYAKVTDRAYIPVEESTSSAAEELKNALCGKGQTGIYTIFSPDFSEASQSSEIKDCEAAYDSGLVPAEINIIIP